MGKQNRVKRKPPQPGTPGFMSPTQLRNARKRRKVKEDRAKKVTAVKTITSDGKTKKAIIQIQDPSLRYLGQPKSAPIIKKAEAFFAEKKMDFPITVGPTRAWRTVAKLAVRKIQGCLRIGLFVSGSHELLEVPQCVAHHDKINAAIEVLQKKCRHHKIESFDDKAGTGNLRHVAINVERSTGRQQLTLVWNEDESGSDADKNARRDRLDQLCQSLIATSEISKQNPHDSNKLEMHSLWIHHNTLWKHANSIFDRDGTWEKKYGDDAVVERLTLDDFERQDPKPTVPLEFPPQVFRQANLDAFTKIVANIRTWLQRRPQRSSDADRGDTSSGSGSSKKGKHKPSKRESKGKGKKRRCLELYGGVGTIGLHVADLFDSLVSSDENPFNKKCFDSTVSNMKNGAKPLKTKIEYKSMNASEMVHAAALDAADVVIVDPPRKGLDEDVVSRLCSTDIPNTLIYVSCGFDAFRRDFDKLTNEGGWKLDRVEGHVLFPGSDAIETLAFFTG